MRPSSGRQISAPYTRSMASAPMLCSHLPNDKPRTQVQPRPATSAELINDTPHLLFGIHAALGPMAYEIFVVVNIPPIAITVIASSQTFHATLKPAHSLNSSFPHS